MKSKYASMLNTVSELLVDAVCIVNMDGVFVYISSAGEQVFGYSPEEMIGRNMKEFIHPDDLNKTNHIVGLIMNGEPQPHFENRYIKKNGDIVHIMWAARWSEEEEVRVAVARDVTQLRQSQALQEAIYTIADAANILGDLDVLYEKIHQAVNPLFHSDNFIIGLIDHSDRAISYPCLHYPPERFLQIQSVFEEFIDEPVVKAGCPVTLSSLDFELQNPIDNKREYWLIVPIRSGHVTTGILALSSFTRPKPYTEKDKNLLCFIANQVNVAIERKSMLLKLSYMAQYDHLTHLPNRALFYDRLQQAQAKSMRSRLRFAILYLDLNEFKPVNDQYGHDAGDLLLRLVALRLADSVRESDTVARLGGDEFAVLLEDIHHIEEVKTITQKLKTFISKPYHLSMVTVNISCSIGIALYPDNASTTESLMRYADERMYEMKSTEKSKIY